MNILIYILRHLFHNNGAILQNGIKCEIVERLVNKGFQKKDTHKKDLQVIKLLK